MIGGYIRFFMLDYFYFIYFKNQPQSIHLKSS